MIETRIRAALGMAMRDFEPTLSESGALDRVYAVYVPPLTRAPYLAFLSSGGAPQTAGPGVRGVQPRRFTVIGVHDRYADFDGNGFGVVELMDRAIARLSDGKVARSGYFKLDPPEDSPESTADLYIRMISIDVEAR